MVNYSCDKCGKLFSQKSHYTAHINKKNPCILESKLIELIEKTVDIKMNRPYTTTYEPIQMTQYVRDEGLDKFYTLPEYSKHCIDKIVELYDISCWELIVEPSAGNGSFLNQIPSNNKIGIDISPEHPAIITQDFLTYSPPTNINHILVIGNPPFGKNSSLAIKFFNHAAKWANVIAFIIPRTFRKVSVQNKLHLSFHLVHDEDVPITPCCFSPPMMAKCCFQVWEKKITDRHIIQLPTTHIDWVFLPFGPIDDKGQPTPPTNADFAMRAYGGKIGEIVSTNLHELRPKSWHWIRSNIDKTELIARFKRLDYSNSLNTARQNSMGRGELVGLYTELINSKF